jgi:DNA-binding response OmpR family regulator
MANQPAEHSDGQNPSADSTAPRTPSRTILLAEDEPAVRDFVRAALGQAGFSVVAAPDGRAAGDLFAADPGRFDLILTDVIMPHALGTELVARARALRPGVPVLFISAFPGGAGAAPDPLPVGENLLEKPFTMATLLDAVNRVLGECPARPG